MDLQNKSLVLVIVLGLLLAVGACTSPSSKDDGVQGRLKATLPVDGVITFE